MVVPHGDNAYYSARPQLAVARPDDSKADAQGQAEQILREIDRLLKLCSTDKSKIIPGHGPVTDLQGLVAYRDMLVDTEPDPPRLWPPSLPLRRP